MSGACPDLELLIARADVMYEAALAEVRGDTEERDKLRALAALAGEKRYRVSRTVLGTFLLEAGQQEQRFMLQPGHWSYIVTGLLADTPHEDLQVQAELNNRLLLLEWTPYRLLRDWRLPMCVVRPRENWELRVKSAGTWPPRNFAVTGYVVEELPV